MTHKVKLKLLEIWLVLNICILLIPITYSFKLFKMCITKNIYF